MEGVLHMPIRNQTELVNYLRSLRTPLPLTPDDFETIVGHAQFLENGKCRGLIYGPLKEKLTFAQFETLMVELNVNISVGVRLGDKVRVHEYPTGKIDPPCVPKDDAFCNPD
jgi:hypothetical protein